MADCVAGAVLHTPTSSSANQFRIYLINVLPHQRIDVEPMLVYCWPTVSDAGPGLNQQWVNVLCLRGAQTFI